MKPFDLLTKEEKRIRLGKIAELALEKYDITVDKIEYLIEETNVFFKVRDSSGNLYALKIFQELSSKIEDNLAEVFLIDTIKKNSDIVVSEVVEAKTHEKIVIVDSKYTQIPKRVALYRWIEGEDFKGNESDDRYYKLGQLAAKLHLATKDITIPANLSPKKWDKVFYYRDEKPVYKEEHFQKYLDKEYHDIMDFIIPYLDEKLSEFYINSTPQLIHADLNPWNVRVYKDELRLLDFEEAMLAYPIHDLAILLFYYRYSQENDYEKVKNLIYDGYRSISALPKFSEYQLELLITARRVNFLNYILEVDDNPTEYINTNIQRVKSFIDKYIK